MIRFSFSSFFSHNANHCVHTISKYPIYNYLGKLVHYKWVETSWMNILFSCISQSLFLFIEFVGILAKCAAAGRDHTPCCQRRGVSQRCLSLCRGVVPQPPVDCLAYGGNIIQCFEEGTENIPGPVDNLHAILVTKSSISLEWVPNEEDRNHTNSKTNKNLDFIVQYGNTFESRK